MKLLKACYKHLYMFEDDWISIDLYAEDKVPEGDESIHILKKPVYTNSVVALAGINASGKTSVLTLVELAIGILNGQPISRSVSDSSFLRRLATGIELRLVFEHQGGLYVLTSKIESDATQPSLRRWEDALRFTHEVLYRWKTRSMPKKSLMADIEDLTHGCTVLMQRDALESDRRALLSHNVSIATSISGGNVLCAFHSALDDLSAVDVESRALTETMRVFDPSIESLEVQPDGRSCVLVFENGPVIHTTTELLGGYLSSGTEKGLGLVGDAIRTLSKGGYLLVDELENHLNKQLVGVIIDLFQSWDTNPNGATLIFTTHYPEVLDRIHRKDNVYFLSRSGGRHAIQVTKYSSKVRRIENKKSEVFLSNYLGGTAPRYSDVQALRMLVREAVAHASA